MIKHHQISSWRPQVGSNAPNGSILTADGSGGLLFSNAPRMAIGRMVDSNMNLSNGTVNFAFYNTLQTTVPELNTALGSFRIVNNSGSNQSYFLELWPQLAAMGSASWGKIDYAPVKVSGTTTTWNAGASTCLPSGSSYAMYYAPFAWASFGVAHGNTVELQMQFTVSTGATTTLSANSIWKLFRF